ncbi:MAG: divergent polysaccharide deacetylase family protein [Nitrospirae bacterium]|nr:divergent polysaccharide deacetylase family protein [Nitrospirota bacterium]
MASRRKTKKSKRHYHIILILVLIILGIFFLYREIGKQEYKPRKVSRQTQPEEIKKIPKIALIIDDLGHNKKAALKILEIKAPLTLSILPHEPYSSWIASEGHQEGHDLIGHIPMEAKEPHKLGKGGLYLWMTDNEIRENLRESLLSIPHIKGVSNHMGSAFTEDKRALSVVISALKERNLFFLDSLTSPHSAGLKIAKEHGIKALKRDVFLDDENTPDYMETQWDKAVKIAKGRGYAIVLAHPKEDTIKFLQKHLPDNEVKIVPLSELYASQ